MKPTQLNLFDEVLAAPAPAPAKVKTAVPVMVYVDADDDWREPQFDSQESLMVLCGWDREKLLTL